MYSQNIEKYRPVNTIAAINFKKVEVKKDSKVQYGDAMIIGALVGFVGVFMAQKYGYLDQENKKFRLYGALGGGLLGVYWVFRNKNTKKEVKVTKSE